MGRHHQGWRPRRIKGPGAEAFTGDPPARGNAKGLIHHEWRLPHPLNPGFPLFPMNPYGPGACPQKHPRKKRFHPSEISFSYLSI